MSDARAMSEARREIVGGAEPYTSPGQPGNVGGEETAWRWSANGPAGHRTIVFALTNTAVAIAEASGHEVPPELFDAHRTTGRSVVVQHFKKINPPSVIVMDSMGAIHFQD